MGGVINLRTERKRAKRRKAEEAAAARRLIHGRTKAEQNLTAARRDKDRKDLDQHGVDRGDGQ